MNISYVQQAGRCKHSLTLLVPRLTVSGREKGIHVYNFLMFERGKGTAAPSDFKF